MWGLHDSNEQFAFSSVTIRPQRVNLLHADSHGDGIPNQWRQDNFGTPGGPPMEEDSDEDGQNNSAEYIAGTQPMDPRSLFAVAMENHIPGTRGTLHWPFAQNRRYTPYFTTNLMQPFQPLATDLATNVFTPTTDGFYRIGVRTE